MSTANATAAPPGPPSPAPSRGSGLLEQPLSLQKNGLSVKERPLPICRTLGSTEVSYFLPSRESGVNDMYLHIGFTAPRSITARSRVGLVWAILRLRHALLASRVKMHDYNDIRFVYDCPSSAKEALDEANATLEYRNDIGKDLIDNYLNGPRTLSNERLSHLIISPCESNASIPSPPPSPTPDQHNVGIVQHDFLLCATHFIGDGMALHTFANEFFSLLGGEHEEKILQTMLDEEWQCRCNKGDGGSTLPTCLEERLPNASEHSFLRAARRVDYDNMTRKQIGGQSFPKQSGKARHTIVPTESIDPIRTKKMLATCKANGVSISAALFALCNVAWATVSNDRVDLPSLMYSALNIRPNLRAQQSLNDSYWFLAIGYFNVILPTFIPKDTADVAKIFWHRARSAKEQSTAAAKSKMLVSRSSIMAEERAVRARAWAKEDDEKAAGTWTPPPPAPVKTQTTPRVPSTALIGLSMLGNLDGMYKHAKFPQIKMHTLTTGSRQRSGGMLLFGYTFAGKLWVSLGYDENGFEPTRVNEFWKHVLAGLDEFLDV